MEFNILIKTKVKKTLKFKRDKKDDPEFSESADSSGKEWPELMTIASDLGGDNEVLQWLPWHFYDGTRMTCM